MTKTLEINNEEELKKMTQDLAHILHNLRFYTKYWQEHGGYHARERRKYWEEMADNRLDSIGLTLHNNISSVKIIKH